MSMVRLFIGRVLRFFQFLAGIFKRAMCFMRKRDNIGELPYTVVSHSQGQSMHSSPETVSWGNDFQWSEKSIVEDKIDQWRKSKEISGNRDQSSEPDFFNDMVPDIKKTKKAILKSKVTPTTPSTKQSLFTFQGDDIVSRSVWCHKHQAALETRLPIQDLEVSGELGELNENEAWDDDISSTLQEHRMMKQKARHEEHDRRMMVKKGVYGQN